MKKIGMVCFMGCLLLATPALAENVYKWTDEQGETHYSKTPPPKTSGYEVQRLNRQALVLESIKPYQPPAPEQADENDSASQVASANTTAAASKAPGKTTPAVAAPTTIEQRALRENIEAQQNELAVAQRSRDGQVQALIDQVGLAAGHQRAGQPVPASISQAVNQLQQSVRQQDGVIRHMEEQISSLRASLEATDPVAQEGARGAAGEADDARNAVS